MRRDYSIEEKLKGIRLYRSGKGSTTVGHLLNVDPSIVLRWVELYDRYGTEGLRKYNRRTEVSMKCKIVRAVLKKGVSCEQIALEYGVGHSSLCKWVHIVQSSGYRGLKKREPNKIKAYVPKVCLF